MKGPEMLRIFSDHLQAKRMSKHLVLGTLFIYIEVSTSVLLRFSFSLNTLIIKIMRVFVRRVAPKDFFFMSFLSGTLTSYRTAGEKGTISNRLYQFYTLTSVLKLCIIYLV